MYLPDIELHEAVTLEQAAGVLTRYAPNARLLAGGTDLLVDLKTGRAGFDHLVSINRIDELRGISETSEGLRIGALTTVTQLGRSTVVQERFSPILDATSRMAAPQIRNVATVGGNIAAAVPCADLPPILTAMNASVVLWSTKGQREVPLDGFFVGPRRTVLGDNEVLTAILVPKLPPRFGAAYARFQLRDGNTIAVAAVAASLLLGDDDTVQDARIVLGAVAPVPKLVESAAALLVGKSLDAGAFRMAAEAAAAEAEPICDVRGSADFRREIVGVMTRRALTTAHSRAREAR
ncbi:MAG: xanthine dehydrogenase family protein subunit M [Planctomycetes bacterium]|nr:xanthine dehydrogenase family protein subunit M [Planctomycetota bacterium]